jgi:ligand-binding sensor domain-containing protein
LLFCFQSGFGQELYMRHFSVEDGLPSNTVYASFQDNRGYMWFATDAGVAVFDGQKFTNFNKSDGLSDNEVFDIHQDRENRIWFSTANGEPCYFLNNTFYTKRNSDLLKQVSFSDFINYYYEDQLGNIYLGSNFGELYRIGSGIVEPLYDIRKSIRAMLLFEEEGALKVIYSTGAIRNFSDGSIENLGFNLQKAARFVKVDNAVFFAIKNTLYRYHLKTKKTETLALNILDSDSRHIISVQLIDQELYVGTWNKTTIVSFSDSLKITDEILKGKGVSSAFKDKEGNCWLTTLGEGVYFTIPTNIRSYSGPDLQNNFINCINQDVEGHVWIGGKNNKLAYQTDSGFVNIPFGNKRTGRGMINAIIPAKDGSIWIGGDDGMVHLVEKKALINVATGAKCFLELEGSEMWIGASSSLIRVTKDNYSNLFDGFISSDEIVTRGRVNEIAKWKDGNLLVVFKNKLKVFHPADTTLHDFPNSNFNDFDINDIKTNDEDLWLATSGNGIIQYTVSGDIRKFDVENGLLNNNCRTLFIDEIGNVYGGTTNGLSKIDCSDKSNVQVVNYTENDGLISNDIHAVFKDSENTIWVGTSEGLSYFREDDIHQKVEEFPLYLTSFTNSGNQLSSDKKHTFKYNQNDIRFDFIGLNYRFSDELTYQYKLVGIDDRWQESTQTYVEYPYLPSGNYTFQLNVAVNGKVINSQPIIVQFEIDKPFWEKWWFYAIIFSLVLGIIFLVIRRRTTIIRKQEALKRKALEAQQTALRAQMNPHFVFNSLNSIQHFIAENDERKALDYLSKFSRVIRRTLSASGKSAVLLSDEVEMLRHYLDLEKLRVDNAFNYTISIGENVKANEIELPPLLLQPYIENAIWHGVVPLKIDGHILISFEQKSDLLVCTIDDNGIGRAAAKASKTNAMHQSVGMLKTEERINLIGEFHHKSCTVEIEDKKSESGDALGTTVVLTLPINYKL